MKNPKLSFVIGFRQASGIILANEPFTLPEPYEPVLEELRKIAPYLELKGPEMRIECPVNGQPRWQAGSFRFVHGSRAERRYWGWIMRQMAQLGADTLKDAAQIVTHMEKSLQTAISDYLKHCGFPRPEQVAIDEQGVDSLEELAMRRHRLAVENLEAKLFLPKLNFLPFPKTVARLMREYAQAQIKEEADAWLAEYEAEGNSIQ